MEILTNFASERKGGMVKAIKELTVWCMILTLLTLMVFMKAKQVKDNYSELHHRVNQIEIHLYGEPQVESRD